MPAEPSRRRFLTGASAALGAASLASIGRFAFAAPAQKRPNFILLVGEDMSPDIGCYGSEFSHTPNLDKLASQGCRYNACFTHCGVCAPSRSGMITGQYPITIGTHDMRSTLLNPPPMFTHYLQEAGYQIIWTNKTDFNFAVPRHGFDSTADWRRGDLPAGPFLAYFNVFTTHESKVRASAKVHARNTARLKPSDRQNPKTIPLPAFYPDTPEVRNDVRQYHELCTAVDYTVGDVMDMLEKKGLADNTVLIFIGDHGRGMPRMKRWCYDDGTHIPLIVRWPNGVKPATVSEELIAMVDLPATILSLAGVEQPAAFGGVPYLGDSVHPRQFVFAHRDRMDEARDRIRSARDHQYRYVRNFHPEIPYAQYVNYNELNPIMQSWRAQGHAGELNPTQRAFFAPTKPAEELYDCQSDPHNVKNLIASADPAIQSRLATLRRGLDQWIADTHDLGAIPEETLVARGLVADRWDKEYVPRLKLHPKTPPYLDAAD